ncbi:MAG: Nitrilase/cyanide hydratase and apolipoprotein N-acyltransferase [Microbacterium sp.]|jgi:predicted amidohydrolase|uniref:carbon-nitrogen hydrolase family protein n=1 Tax=Microbacterium sp. TaxID=51671 RepID=UPI00262369C9|nr:carbon-nitrogen hydrolase family protein [Microbacterium sp.]MDF2561732.1 Nitrilase/cyanide hydratase and apolipoprotein N-acyltransferase [Microbacterium sp.]
MTESDIELIVGCVQMQSRLNPDDNLTACIRAAHEASRRGVQLLVFPETASSRSDDPEVTPHAEDIGEGFVPALASALADLDMTIIVGVTEGRGEERPYNTLVAMRRGRIVAVYRKLHLYDAAGMRESDLVTPGEGPVATFDVDGFRVGLMTCYDVRFPELARLLSEQGADILAIPASWVHGPLKEEHWRTLCAARAIENTVYVLGAAQTGGTRIGRSAVIAPDGVAEAAAGYAEELIVARVSARRLSQARARFPMLQQTRFAIDAVPRPAPASVSGAGR